MGGDWERRRAVIGLLDIAREALVTADAMVDDDGATSTLKDAIYAARIAAQKAVDVVPPMQEWGK